MIHGLMKQQEENRWKKYTNCLYCALHFPKFWILQSQYICYQDKNQVIIPTPKIGVIIMQQREI